MKDKLMDMVGYAPNRHPDADPPRHTQDAPAVKGEKLLARTCQAHAIRAQKGQKPPPGHPQGLHLESPGLHFGARGLHLGSPGFRFSPSGLHFGHSGPILVVLVPGAVLEA